MLTIEFFYGVAGLLLLANGVLTLLERNDRGRWASASFWFLFGLLFLAGDWLPPVASGVLVLAMCVLGGFNLVSGKPVEKPDESRAVAGVERLGVKLFWPALAIPGFTLIGALGFPFLAQHGIELVDPGKSTLVSLGIGCLLAFVLAIYFTREAPVQGFRESARLMDSIGWAMLLPQMLATLGILFAQAGVGEAVADLVGQILPEGQRFWAIVAFALGMALFTIIMGNAFAAFPVITAGIGIPFLVEEYHSNVAVMAAIGMFCGYCGTLMTPMAANFNIVPAALLELQDRNAVIKAQVPTALMVLVANIGLLWWLL